MQKNDRIRLVEMPGDPDPVPEGTEGTVEMVLEYEGATQIAVRWDNGRRLGLAVPPDLAVVIGHVDD